MNHYVCWMDGTIHLLEEINEFLDEKLGQDRIVVTSKNKEEALAQFNQFLLEEEYES